MNHWYLVASLPALTPAQLGAGTPLALGEPAFRTLCGEHLPDRELQELDAVLAGGGRSPFARAWQQHRLHIQDECALQRAARLAIDASPWRTDTGVPDLWLGAAVRDAMQQQDPKAREGQLDALRWRLLEQLGQAEPFGLPAVLSYGLRLQLAARWQGRTEAAGRERLGQHLQAMLDEFDRLARGGDAAGEARRGRSP